MTVSKQSQLTQAVRSSSVAEAKNILRGESASPERMRELASALKKEKAFGFARRVLARARRHPQVSSQSELALELAQQEAHCTVNDVDLPADKRFDRALKILSGADNLETTDKQETLGIAGGIYKRKWEVGGQRRDLERALSYYRRGYEQGIEKDMGYTAINAAFMLDLLASLELAEASGNAEQFKTEARRIREEIVQTLSAMLEKSTALDKDWWFLVTLAEANFGLMRYADALGWLEKAAGLPNIPEWQFETTAKQLAAIARMQAERRGAEGEMIGSDAWETLREFLKGNEVALRSALIGKVGLALSGGGFRASLYHIGVLAKLAELDMLRHVEVLSCVSGGSIIGAHYYLEVRRLLQTKQDADVTREDYIEVVRNIERDFLAGVQTNMRNLVFLSPTTWAKKLFSRQYTKTRRIGEMFEEEIFSKVDDGEGEQERYLNNLFVQPRGESESFRPKNDNWRRQAKVPVLILNATTLNTGHSWQFTASWMGESPAMINSAIDANYILRRMYYNEAPEDHRKIRLGHAVAASACVPGLFEPLVLTELYPKRKISLVDGGVHDNQGIGGLLEQDCTVLLVSDASGQMQPLDEPKSWITRVLGRSNSILQARVRESEYDGLVARRRTSLLRGLMFVHLKMGLTGQQIDWVGCEDPVDASDEAIQPEERGTLTFYGIRKDVQEALAAIRTDLDSFSEAEAYALMTSGYRMTEHELARESGVMPKSEAAQIDWKFLSVEAPMKRAEGASAAHKRLMKLLATANHRGLKPWRLANPFSTIAIHAALLALLASLYFALHWALSLFTKGWVTNLLTIILLLLFVWPIARLYLFVYNDLYLSQGKIDGLAAPASLAPSKPAPAQS